MESVDSSLGRDSQENAVPLAAFTLLRVFLGVMWLYEALRGAPWEIAAWIAGILLLLGLFTPIAAGVGLVTAFIVLQQAGPVTAWGNWVWLHWLVILMHLLVGLTAAGRVFGIDALLAARRPRWPLW